VGEWEKDLVTLLSIEEGKTYFSMDKEKRKSEID